MVGLYLLYTSSDGSSNKVRVKNYAFDGSISNTAHDKDAGEGREYRLKCLCGGDSWSDDGCYINQYVCECCGQAVSVSVRQGGE